MPNLDFPVPYVVIGPNSWSLGWSCCWRFKWSEIPSEFRIVAAVCEVVKVRLCESEVWMWWRDVCFQSELKWGTESISEIKFYFLFSPNLSFTFWKEQSLEENSRYMICCCAVYLFSKSYISIRNQANVFNAFKIVFKKYTNYIIFINKYYFRSCLELQILFLTNKIIPANLLIFGPLLSFKISMKPQSHHSYNV